MKKNFYINKIKFNFKIVSLFVFIIAIIIIYSQNNLEILKVSAEGESDGIAVRVITNPDHYSPMRWYVEQGFSGSPQPLKVDGYDALRDGRTVYVNATNIAGLKLYTNIYLISYSQSADNMTTDIFNQLIGHWKFNSNISTSGYCSQETTKQCLYNSDCSSGDYCNSQKSKIIRDTRRLADLKEIKLRLEIASSTHAHHPKLGAGTYLPNSTTSVWPSWQESLAEELDVTLPIDPLNKLGDCCPSGATNCTASYNYDPKTCWDEQNRAFAGIISSSAPSVLPVGSYLYTYGSNSDGSGYYACAVLETNYNNLITSGSGAPYTYCLYSI